MEKNGFHLTKKRFPLAEKKVIIEEYCFNYTESRFTLAGIEKRIRFYQTEKCSDFRSISDSFH